MGDADAAGHHDDATGAESSGGHGAVRALEPDLGAGRDVRQSRRRVTQGLDGDPHAVSGAGGGAGQAGHGVGVRLVGEPGGVEAPVEELAGLDVEAGEVAAAHDDGHDVVGLTDDGLHPQRVPAGGDDRDDDAVVGDEPEDGDVQADPQGAGRAGEERAAGGDLVRKREENGEVGVEVDRPPRLVLDATAGVLPRCEASRDEEEGAGEGGQDPGHRRRQRPQLGPPAGAEVGCVGGDDQHDVREHEAQRPRADGLVPRDEPVLPVDPFEDGQAGDEQHEHQHAVGADDGREHRGGVREAGPRERDGQDGLQRQPDDESADDRDPDEDGGRDAVEPTLPSDGRRDVGREVAAAPGGRNGRGGRQVLDGGGSNARGDQDCHGPNTAPQC